MQNRKNQQNQQKEWRQQWKVSSRKLDESQKSYMKLLTSFADTNPEVTAKTNAILAQFDSMCKKSEKQSTSISTKLKKINETIEQLRQTLKYFDKTNESLLKVQKLSEGIFGRMEGMKNEMANSYDELDEMERKISGDLDMIGRRIEGFDEEEAGEYYAPVPVPATAKKSKNKENLSVQNKTKIPKKSPQLSHQYQSEQLPKDPISQLQQKMQQKQQQVQQIEQQIRQLGKYLGWHEEDHKDFLTIWNRNQPNKTYFEIQDQLTEYFRMYTGEQIIQHMNRYMKFKKLGQKKKIVIGEYKELKQLKKGEEIARLQAGQQQKAKQKRKEQQLRRMEQEQKQMKQKVEMWKKQKQESKIQEKRRQLQQQQRRKQQQIAVRRQEQQKRRELMQKWKQQQQQKQKQKQKQQSAHQQKRPHSAINKQTRDRIRQREQQLLRQKTQKALSLKIHQQQLLKKAEKIKQAKMIKYAHVGSKLEEKTTAIKEKEREKWDGKEKKEANTFGGQLLMTGVRAVPSWRQGL